MCSEAGRLQSKVHTRIHWGSGEKGGEERQGEARQGEARCSQRLFKKELLLRYFKFKKKKNVAVHLAFILKAKKGILLR